MNWKLKEQIESAILEFTSTPPLLVEASDNEMSSALQGLSTLEKDVLYRYYWQRQSTNEISSTLELRAATAFLIRYRALKKLARRLFCESYTEAEVA